MPRALKPQVVVKQYQPIANVPIRVDLMLNRGNLRFFFEFQGETYEEGDIGHLKTKAREVIKASIDIQVIPMIRVSLSLDHTPKIELSVDRKYIAKRNDGKWIRISWHVFEKYRDNKGELLKFADYDWETTKQFEPVGTFEKPLIVSKHNHTLYFIPYDESLYTGLMNLQAALRLLGEKIVGLLGSEEGQAIIANTVYGSLLGSGESDE